MKWAGSCCGTWQTYRRDGWKSYASADPAFAQIERREYEKRFDRTLPGVNERGDVAADVSDLIDASARIQAAIKPVRQHRNTITAHRDPKPRPATFDDIRRAFAALDDHFDGIYFVASGGTQQQMHFGGGSSIKAFANAWTALMVRDDGAPTVDPA